MPTKSIPVNFTVKIPEPIEGKMVSPTLADRDGIPVLERFRGLLTYVVDLDKFYYLSGGITNSHWKPLIGEYDFDLILDAVRQAPVYSAPTASMANNSQTREIGENISALAFNIIFNRNDAGAPTGFSLNESLSNSPWSKISSTQNNNLSNVAVIAGTKRFRGSVEYAQGAVKNNNLGEADERGRIPAGTVHTNITTVTGLNKIFFGAVTSVPSNSAQTRGLPQNAFENVPHIDLETGTSATKFVVAVPAGKSIVKVNDLTNLNADLTGNYVLVNPSFPVNNAGGEPGNTKLYVFSTEVPYSPAAVHRILIG